MEERVKIKRGREEGRRVNEEGRRGGGEKGE
jgi:hypothetical protein